MYKLYPRVPYSHIMGGNIMKKKQTNKPINLTELEPLEKMKYEIAEELGLLDRVMEEGWKNLTAKETGRIGGLVTKRKKQIKNELSGENKQ